MADITSDMIKELREKTQAGMLDCKKALIECGGDMEAAVDYLRKKGLAAANKREGRIAKEGIIASYIHNNSKIGVLLELNCETDFVARNQDFQNLAKDLCMQVAAANPLYVSPEDVAADVLEREKEIYREQLKESGKPANVIEKIVEGKLQKFYSEVCLLEQEFIKDNKVIIKDLIKNKIATYGENITVGRFVRFQIGQR
ncbi:MAG TPA: translation elongation factor Ts [Spirochaetota bacterium]|nr:translation elongation factor Ts [Spirochaetota bacterium]HOF14003.1 translation elongation factor Ts [Spirochaetota bacterium]HOM87754.1 translation elongation factor Ts [Spirochaetota bacterium]HOT18858.1 translation elongation factor Ts [Spirochaetota bacterium]HPK44623.1 translation elongation factor Ts [Spirochaetota bacterium]